MFFSEKTNYRIEGLDDKEEPQAYLQSILKDRLEKEISAEKGTEAYKRMASYREEAIKTDLAKAMRAKGYYEAKVEYQDSEDTQLSGTYLVQAGPLYTVSSITTKPENLKDALNITKIKAGDALEAGAVLHTQNELFKAHQKNRCHFSLDIQHVAVLNKENKTADLSYVVNKGPEAKFGPALFEGHTSIKSSYLQKLVPWEEGDCFQREKIEALKTNLLETGLFVRAESSTPAQLPQDKHVPVTVQLKERAPRSIKAGLNYYTDTGAGIQLGWEHRNLFGEAEKLKTNLDINQVEQEINADFTKPFFLRKDQSLNINTALGLKETDAYKAKSFDVGTSIERHFTRQLSGSLGTSFSLSEVKDQEDTRNFGLFSLPVDLIYDNRDNTLDPHKGWLLTAGAEPFFDAIGESEPFTKLQAGARTYLHLVDDPDLVLALRTNIGSLIGDDRANIPATERFYAGGGGSVRGFEYQGVGPHEDGEPIGGRSIVTGSTEMRFNLSNDFGAVAFLDAGSVSESTSPNLDNMAFGAGVGVRYFTGFGPLRFDVAVPLNRKSNSGDDYQFYISIGQAF